MRTRILFILAILTGSAHLAGATSAEAQLTLTRSTVDGGGGRSTGGSFASTGTVGQADAGALAGGAFVLSGGFWFGGGAVSGVADGTDDSGNAITGRAFDGVTVARSTVARSTVACRSQSDHNGKPDRAEQPEDGPS